MKRQPDPGRRTRLHLPQPAVCLQIKSLQTALNLQLFSRTPSGMALTKDGAKLLPFAQRGMASIAEFRQGANALYSTLRGTLATKLSFITLAKRSNEPTIAAIFA